MALFKPKRIEELSPLENEDAYKTPIRSSFTENTTKKAFYPKRISELSPLESSDDEDNERNSLNNAFLNDSFVETPLGKSDSGVETDRNLTNNFSDNTFAGLTVIKEEEQPDSQKKGDATTSRQLKFNSFAESESDRPTIALFSKLSSNSFLKKSDECPNKIANEEGVVPVQTNSVPDNKAIDNLNTLVDAISVKKVVSAPLKSSHLNDFNTPKVCAIEKPPVNGSCKLGEDFHMPASNTVLRRLQSSQHRSLLSSGNQSRKCRSDLEKEFKSQKVLFTTPSTVSRPTNKLMQNIETLDDSLDCFKGSPMVDASTAKLDDNVRKIKKPSPPVQNTVDCYRKSIDNIDGSEIKEKIEKEKEKENLPTNNGQQQKVLRINGKDFIIRERIGQGGSSSVFLAEHKETKLECALKVVNLNADPALVQSFIKEVKILAMLQDRVNVIRLYEYALISSENILYMVMEKGDSDLRKILSTYKTSLPLYTLMSYWHQMLQSVHYIHKNDIIHSDLKPENFLMVRGRLKLIDFGISSKMAVDATSIIKFSQVGTFNYISPEALMDTSTGDSPMTKKNQPKIKISPKSDVWSLGCILYLLLYKKTPFAHIKNIYAKMQAIINPEKKIDYPDIPNYYPSMLLEMVKLCLIHNPKQRSSVADLLNFPFDMVIPMSTNNNSQ